MLGSDTVYHPGEARIDVADGKVDVHQATVEAAVTDGRDGAGDDDVEVVVGEVEAVPQAGDAGQAPPDAVVEDDRGDGDGADDGDGGAGGDGSDSAGDGDVAVVTYEEQIVEALPDLARLAAVAGTRTLTWGLRIGLRATARLARATVDPQAAADLAEGVGAGMRAYAREFLGITELEERVRLLTPVGDRFVFSASATLAVVEHDNDELSPELLLRAQGAELLRQSADVTTDDRLHPAFGRILGELAPDEGRIMRLLAAEGPQPVVDVRAVSLIGTGSQLVAQNLNMVGMPAGVRHGDRVSAYLVNLQRLGLVCFADEPLRDEIAYQLLEAQPHVLEAIKSASRAKTVQRSLRLTPFGDDFCAVCFPREYDEVKELTSGPDQLAERAARDALWSEDGDQPTPSENSELGS